MTISSKDWSRFVEDLAKISQQAVTDLLRFVNQNGGLEAIERYRLLDYAYALATKYGEGTAAMAATWYDQLAEASGMAVPAAVVAQIGRAHV